MEKKWQYIRYMPNLPLGEGGKKLTCCKEHIELARTAAAEGMVLLKNQGGLLPFGKGTRVAFFGKGQADYVKGGGGSGDTTTPYSRSLLMGMEIKEAEGKVKLFGPLGDYYGTYVAEAYGKGIQPGLMPEPELPRELLRDARIFTDTAVIVLCRYSLENSDRSGVKGDGDFYLSPGEECMVRQVMETFPKVAVVLNTGGMMDTLWFKDEPRVQGVLLAWQGGMEGGLAMADILLGEVNPSGRLSDSFAVDFDAYPSSAGFNESDVYVNYSEDIYVGYRYFATIPGAEDKLCYPFGYGLSYTDFEEKLLDARAGEKGIALEAAVRNVGARAGKQVLQLYASAPQGKLGKPARVLCGFAKTKLLLPGEEQVISIAAPVESFASFDGDSACWVLEKGTYRFFLGDNVRDAAEIGCAWTLEEDMVLEKLQHRAAPKELPECLQADGTYKKLPVTEQERPGWEKELLPFDGQAPMENPWVPGGCTWLGPDRTQFLDVAEGRISLEAFMDLLSDEQLVNLLCGQPNRGVANTYGVGNLPLYGVPNAMTADGPAGLRIRPECGVTTTAFPCATLLACTWDTGLAERVGAAAAAEVLENGIGIWLAPAMNIHRSPLCGRNFEYYSEDPLLSGRMAAAMVRGVQSRGVAATIKHFACNNKEHNRRESDSRLSERALREIYLKGFEICVKEARPWCVMSSYNLINGVRASENWDLLTGVLREEWGFEGLVMTDWYTHALQYTEIGAGNDLKMGCGMPEHTLNMLHRGALKREDLLRSAKRVLELLLKIN